MHSCLSSTSSEVFKWGMFVDILAVGLLPFLAIVAQNRALLWTFLALLLVLRGCGENGAWTSQNILLNNSASKNAGAINGLAASMMALTR